MICGCTEERAQLLQEVDQLWQEADTERDRLAGWLTGVERMLRNGGANPESILVSQFSILLENKRCDYSIYCIGTEYGSVLEPDPL